MKRFLQLFKKQTAPEIIVISGLPRTGTSMMMKMVVAGGVLPLTDNIRCADEENPKGYYEFERVKKLPEGDVAWLKTAKGKVVKVISTLLPYLPDSYHYRILFMERDLDEVLASQKKMLIRLGKQADNVSDEKMASLFTNHLLQVDIWLKSHKHHTQSLKVNYNALMVDSKPSLLAINDFLGGGRNIEAMQQVIDTSLYRNRRND